MLLTKEKKPQTASVVFKADIKKQSKSLRILKLICCTIFAAAIIVTAIVGYYMLFDGGKQLLAGERLSTAVGYSYDVVDDNSQDFNFEVLNHVYYNTVES